jgi:hypothetical protein
MCQYSIFIGGRIEHCVLSIEYFKIQTSLFPARTYRSVRAGLFIIPCLVPRANVRSVRAGLLDIHSVQIKPMQRFRVLALSFIRLHFL